MPRDDRPIEDSPYWAEGPTLVVRRGAQLPERCVLCNEPAVRRVKKRFGWHSPWYYLLILGGLMLYLVAVLFVTRRMSLSLPLCARHAKRHRSGTRLQILGLIAIAIGFLGLISIQTTEPLADFGPTGALAVMVLAALGAMVIGSFLTKIIKVRRISVTHGRFSAGAAFLASCPDHWWATDEELADRDEWPGV